MRLRGLFKLRTPRCRRLAHKPRPLWSVFRRESQEKYLFLADQCWKNMGRDVVLPERARGMTPPLLGEADLRALGFRLRKGKELRHLMYAVSTGTFTRKQKRMKIMTSIAEEISKVVAFVF